MKTLLLTFLLAYTFNFNNNELKGKVIDKSTSEELAGVMVILNKTDTTYTDFDGNFKFKNINKINKLELKYISYKTDSIIIDNQDLLRSKTVVSL